jgi:hypothetical protein
MGFIIKGVRKGAYNQFDSYPSGLGNDIIRFILALSEEDILAMQAKVEAVRPSTYSSSAEPSFDVSG